MTFISKGYYTLLIFSVAPLSLNSCFNVPGKKCIQILYHLPRCKDAELHNSSLALLTFAQ